MTRLIWMLLVLLVLSMAHKKPTRGPAYVKELTIIESN